MIPKKTRRSARTLPQGLGLAMLAALALLFAGPAAAGTIYDVSSADADPVYSNHSGGHSVWIPGLSTDLDFDPGATLMVSGSEWVLSGVVRDGNIAFQVDFTYSNIMDYATAHALDPMTPKLELKAAAYAANGGPIDPTTWAFASQLDGSLTALAGSTYEGAVLSASLRGPNAQFGVGANGKNLNLGLSNWQELVLVVQAQGASGLSGSYTGDVNIDASANPIPEPTSALVFLVGAAVLRAGVRRR